MAEPTIKIINNGVEYVRADIVKLIKLCSNCKYNGMAPSQYPCHVCDMSHNMHEYKKYKKTVSKV